MKIRAIFKTNKIPIGYRMMFVSLIKNLLSNYCEEYYNEIYTYNEGKNKKTKNFAFSVFMKDFKKEENVFLTNEVTLNISSPDKKLILYLYNSLIRMKEYEYDGEYKIYKNAVKIINHKKIDNDYCMFKTMSPIAVKNKDGRFLNIDDAEYFESLNYIVNQSLINYRGKGLSREIEFIPVDLKKVVVKEKITSFTEKTGKEYMCVNSYSGVFILKGSNEDLNDIHKLGIGFRRNQCFGMIDLV